MPACGDTCSEHAEMHEHCRVCAEACRATEQALAALLPRLQPSGTAPESSSEAAPQDTGTVLSKAQQVMGKVTGKH